MGVILFGLFGSLYAVLSFAVIAAVAVLVIWALILVITFLRLRIAQLRSSEDTGTPAAERRPGALPGSIDCFDVLPR